MKIEIKTYEKAGRWQYTGDPWPDHEVYIPTLYCWDIISDDGRIQMHSETRLKHIRDDYVRQWKIIQEELNER